MKVYAINAGYEKATHVSRSKQKAVDIAIQLHKDTASDYFVEMFDTVTDGSETVFKIVDGNYSPVQLHESSHKINIE